MSDTDVGRIIGFESPCPLAISQVDSTEWELTAPLVYYGTRQIFTVPIGARTDLASIPRWLRALIKFDEAASAALHDWLWRCEVPRSADLPPTERVTYRDADGLLRQALLTQGVGLLRRWVIWDGVRLGALTRPDGWRGWWRDFPAVLAISLLMTPIALLPTPLGLALFNLAEWAVSPLDRRRHQLPVTHPALVSSEQTHMDRSPR
ncbi:MAG: DUF1353 domain-containing protein [Pseudonocardiaceae bacterium]